MLVAGEERIPEVFGGQCRWGARKVATERRPSAGEEESRRDISDALGAEVQTRERRRHRPGEHDEADIEVGVDGWVQGHQQAAAAMLDSVGFDDEGFGQPHPRRRVGGITPGTADACQGQDSGA